MVQGQVYRDNILQKQTKDVEEAQDQQVGVKTSLFLSPANQHEKPVYSFNHFAVPLHHTPPYHIPLDILFQRGSLVANQLQVVTKEVVEAARQNLIIGPG